MDSKGKKILALSGLACLVFFFFMLKAGRLYYDHRVPNFERVAEIYVYPGTGADSLFAQISRKAGVRRKRSLGRQLSKIDSVHVGHYTINKGNTSVYVARMIGHGWQTPVELSLNGSLRRQSDIARKISRQMLMDSLDVIKALRDSALLGSLGFAKEDYFALFIPDNYEVYWTDSIGHVLDLQKKAYDAYWTKENLAKASALSLTKIEVSTLASIVKGETNHEPEMPKIAGVYLNRLRHGMKLQADPTIAFCFDYGVNRIRRGMLKVDSPYNTYINYGLPPHPIQVPTRACLDAVLNADTADGYLYFCASPALDGTHLFASTYSEHQKNARAFSRALDARNEN